MRLSLLERTLSPLTPPLLLYLLWGHRWASGSQRRLDTQTLQVNSAGHLGFLSLNVLICKMGMTFMCLLPRSLAQCLAQSECSISVNYFLIYKHLCILGLLHPCFARE